MILFFLSLLLVCVSGMSLHPGDGYIIPIPSTPLRTGFLTYNEHDGHFPSRLPGSLISSQGLYDDPFGRHRRTFDRTDYSLMRFGQRRNGNVNFQVHNGNRNYGYSVPKSYRRPYSRFSRPTTVIKSRPLVTSRIVGIDPHHNDHSNHEPHYNDNSNHQPHLIDHSNHEPHHIDHSNHDPHYNDNSNHQPRLIDHSNHESHHNDNSNHQPHLIDHSNHDPHHNDHFNHEPQHDDHSNHQPHQIDHLDNEPRHIDHSGHSGIRTLQTRYQIRPQRVATFPDQHRHQDHGNRNIFDRESFGSWNQHPYSHESTILREQRIDPLDGEYSSRFQTSNGIQREEIGSLGPHGTIVQRGGWSFTHPDGTLAEFKYIADENGFRVESPLIPPIPPHALAQIEKARIEDAHLSSYGSDFDVQNHDLNVYNSPRHNHTTRGNGFPIDNPFRLYDY